MKTLIVVLALLFVGCSTATNIISKDLARTVELAEKYQAPAVVQCLKFMQYSIEGVKELAAEPTAGLFSQTFKASLLKHAQAEFEDAFAQECGPVAARILVEAGRRLPGAN